MNEGILGVTQRIALPSRELLGQPSSIASINASNGFDLRSINDLQLWLDASDLETLGRAESPTGSIVDGGAVKCWADKSGRQRNATQATDAKAPSIQRATLNGRTTIRLNGATWMQGSYTGLAALRSQTTIAVLRMASAMQTVNFARLFSQSDAAFDWQTPGHYIPILKQGLTNNIGSYATGNGRAALTPALDRWFVFCSRHTGAQIQNTINNGPQSVFVHTLNKLFTRYMISIDMPEDPTAISFWQDGIAEIAMYSRALTDTERLRVVRHMGGKWGIVVS